jgi:hypothetical protein
MPSKKKSSSKSPKKPVAKKQTKSKVNLFALSNKLLRSEAILNGLYKNRKALVSMSQKGKNNLIVNIHNEVNKTIKKNAPQYKTYDVNKPKPLGKVPNLMEGSYMNYRNRQVPINPIPKTTPAQQANVSPYFQGLASVEGKVMYGRPAAVPPPASDSEAGTKELVAEIKKLDAKIASLKSIDKAEFETLRDELARNKQLLDDKMNAIFHSIRPTTPPIVRPTPTAPAPPTLSGVPIPPTSPIAPPAAPIIPLARNKQLSELRGDIEKLYTEMDVLTDPAIRQTGMVPIPSLPLPPAPAFDLRPSPPLTPVAYDPARVPALGHSGAISGFPASTILTPGGTPLTPGGEVDYRHPSYLQYEATFDDPITPTASRRSSVKSSRRTSSSGSDVDVTPDLERYFEVPSRAITPTASRRSSVSSSISMPHSDASTTEGFLTDRSLRIPQTSPPSPIIPLPPIEEILPDVLTPAQVSGPIIPSTYRGPPGSLPPLPRVVEGDGKIGTGIPPPVKSLLNKYADWEIFKMRVVRVPLSKVFEKLGNVMTLGKLKKNMGNLHIDEFFHLYLEFAIRKPQKADSDDDDEKPSITPKESDEKPEKSVSAPKTAPKTEAKEADSESEPEPEAPKPEDPDTDLAGGKFVGTRSDTQVIKMEKNQKVIAFEDRTGGLGKKQAAINVPLRGKKITFQEYIDNMVDKIPTNKLWVYDARTANCQDFVKDSLTANGLWNPRFQPFVMQTVAKAVPHWVGKMIKVTTNLARVLDTIRGKGLMGGTFYTNDDFVNAINSQIVKVAEPLFLQTFQAMGATGQDKLGGFPSNLGRIKRYQFG